MEGVFLLKARGRAQQDYSRAPGKGKGSSGSGAGKVSCSATRERATEVEVNQGCRTARHWEGDSGNWEGRRGYGEELDTGACGGNEPGWEGELWRHDTGSGQPAWLREGPQHVKVADSGEFCTTRLPRGRGRSGMVQNDRSEDGEGLGGAESGKTRCGQPWAEGEKAQNGLPRSIKPCAQTGRW